MKRFWFLTLILVFFLISVTACGKNTNETVTAEQEKPVDTVQTDRGDAQGDSAETKPTDTEKPTYVIHVGGLDLKYSEKWKDKVTVSVLDDRAEFSCGEIKLFDIVFNSEEGNVLGTIRGEKNTVVSVVDYPLEKDAAELMEMKMDVNVILWNLERDYDFIPDEAAPDETTATFDIPTPVVTLKYPARWQDKVTVDVSSQGVSFAAGETKLFDLMFVECDGFLLGTYEDTPIYIIDYNVNSEEEARMQQDVNVILQYLFEDSNFVSA